MREDLYEKPKRQPEVLIILLRIYRLMKIKRKTSTKIEFKKIEIKKIKIMKIKIMKTKIMKIEIMKIEIKIKLIKRILMFGNNLNKSKSQNK